jgi:hypothetical protein
MTMPEFGDAASPRPRKPVRPSHSVRSRRLLGVPWQGFELAFLDTRVRTEEAFRRFCMFGRLAPEPLAGCQQPVRIGTNLYDAEALRNQYIAQGVGAAIQTMLEQARQGEPLGVPNSSGSSTEQAVAALRQAALRPLVRDALLIEICTSRGRVVDLDLVGPNLAALAFEVFLADPAPHELPYRIAQELAAEGLVRRTVIELLDRMEVFGPREMGGAVVRNSLLPRWQGARLRRMRAHEG